ncbi:MAG: hypothetical protein WAZ77_03100 [Candidatus Nitrosopolaris sp.]
MDQRTYPFLILASYQDVSTISQAEASKPPQLKKMQECNRCKAVGFPNPIYWLREGRKTFHNREN